MTDLFHILAILAAGAFMGAWAWSAGCLLAPRIRLPAAIRFSLGAVPVSLCIFALLSAHAGYPSMYLGLAAITGLAAWRIRALHAPRLPFPLLLRVVLGIAACLYLLIVLAPEIQPDAVTYHLRLTRDYAALHHFTNRIEFFDVMPQGAQMLFVPAFAMGGASAAKIVHLLFLLATIPLIRVVASEFLIDNLPAASAAALFFLSPIAGVDGTSAYVDMILVCSCLATLYLLLRWNRERSHALLFCAGLTSGFCYSVKQTFGWIAIAALIFTVVRARSFLVAAYSAIPVLPWMMRAWWLTGNPFAPFLNRFFPNGASTPAIEASLSNKFSILAPTFSWTTALADYTIRGGHQGLFGIAFLLLPLIVLCFRKREGRWLLLASFVFALPFLVNTGARFLLPAFGLFSLALVSVLPSRVACALVAIQAAGAVPALLNWYGPAYDWRLREIPFAAALRIEPESDYLRRRVNDMGLAPLLETNTPPGARIFSFEGVPELYVERQVLTFWYSTQSAAFVHALELGKISVKIPTRLYPEDEAQAVNGWRGGELPRTSSPLDLRRDATNWIRRSGYQYLLIPEENSPFSPLAKDMASHQSEWGLTAAGAFAWHRLYRIEAMPKVSSPK